MERITLSDGTSMSTYPGNGHKVTARYALNIGNVKNFSTTPSHLGSSVLSRSDYSQAVETVLSYNKVGLVGIAKSVQKSYGLSPLLIETQHSTFSRR